MSESVKVGGYPRKNWTKETTRNSSGLPCRMITISSCHCPPTHSAQLTPSTWPPFKSWQSSLRLLWGWLGGVHSDLQFGSRKSTRGRLGTGACCNRARHICSSCLYTISQLHNPKQKYQQSRKSETFFFVLMHLEHQSMQKNMLTV